MCCSVLTDLRAGFLDGYRIPPAKYVVVGPVGIHRDGGRG